MSKTTSLTVVCPKVGLKPEAKKVVCEGCVAEAEAEGDLGEGVEGTEKGTTLALFLTISWTASSAICFSDRACSRFALASLRVLRFSSYFWISNWRLDKTLLNSWSLTWHRYLCCLNLMEKLIFFNIQRCDLDLQICNKLFELFDRWAYLIYLFLLVLNLVNNIGKCSFLVHQCFSLSLYLGLDWHAVPWVSLEGILKGLYFYLKASIFAEKLDNIFLALLGNSFIIGPILHQVLLFCFSFLKFFYQFSYPTLDCPQRPCDFNQPALWGWNLILNQIDLGCILIDLDFHIFNLRSWVDIFGRTSFEFLFEGSEPNSFWDNALLNLQFVVN